MSNVKTIVAINMLCASLQLQAAPLGYVMTENWNFGAEELNDQTELRNHFYTRYIYNNGTLDKLNDEWQRYRDNNNHVFTSTSLKLVARVVSGLYDGGIESGMLRSKWTGKYGYFEARVKVPRGAGMWPAFWLISQDQKWPPEIDIMEVVNNCTDTTMNSFHYVHGTPSPIVNYKNANSRGAYTPGFDYATGFHIFAMEWTDSFVKHYVDGKRIYDRTWEWLHNDGADGGPAHILINLAVGGFWPGPPHSVTQFPASFEIDYIRVWKKL